MVVADCAGMDGERFPRKVCFRRFYALRAAFGDSGGRGSSVSIAEEEES